MIVKRYIASLFKKRICRSRYLGLYFLFLCVGICMWFVQYKSTADEYIIASFNSGSHVNSFLIRGGGIGTVKSRIISIFSAYYDHRVTNFGAGVRIFAVSADRKVPLHCCFQFVNSEIWICSKQAVKTKVLSTKNVRHGATVGNYNVYEVMYICNDIPQIVLAEKPTSVLLVGLSESAGKAVVHAEAELEYLSQRGHVTNNNSFTVCVYHKHSKNLKSFSEKQDIVEFVELTKLLGASQWVFYNASDVISSVLDSIRGISVNQIHWRSHLSTNIDAFPLLCTNDCIYRNMDEDYVVLLDVNEMLVPTLARNWVKMTDSLRHVHNSTKVGAYMFQVLSFYDETTNGTALYAIKSSTGSRLAKSQSNPKRRESLILLPRAVRFRSRARNGSSEVVVMAEPAKVDHVTGNGNMKMLPGHYYINAPMDYGSVHNFIYEHRPLKGLTVDSTKDKLVPQLLRRMHIMDYSIS